MFRPCQKCGNSNHISAHICQCGFQIIGTPKTELQPEFKRAAEIPLATYKETFPTKSPSLPKESLLQASRKLAEERRKQAIREELLARELELRKSASGKLKINLKNSIVGVSLITVIGAMLALFGGFASITENSEGKQYKREPTSFMDTGLAPGSPNLTTSNPAGNNAVEGKVAKVVDVGSGDTITVVDYNDYNNQEYQIKLEGIDAPELEQNFGREAERNLFNLAYGKTVQVSLQETVDGNFTVGKVLLNGKNVSLEQLKAGLAWHDKNVALEQSDNDLYARSETISRRNGFGLWAVANPIPPWEYRNKTNSKQGERLIAASDTNVETPKAVPNAAPNVKTIVQEKRDTTESQTASIETAPKSASIKFSESTNRISPSSRASAPVFSSFENKIIVVPRADALAKLHDGSTPPTKNHTRPRIYNSVPRVNCFVIEGGKKVYLKTCGN